LIFEILKIDTPTCGAVSVDITEIPADTHAIPINDTSDIQCYFCDFYDTLKVFQLLKILKIDIPTDTHPDIPNTPTNETSAIQCENSTLFEHFLFD